MDVTVDDQFAQRGDGVQISLTFIRHVLARLRHHQQEHVKCLVRITFVLQ
jgi:hypothetical protein